MASDVVIRILNIYILILTLSWILLQILAYVFWILVLRSFHRIAVSSDQFYAMG